MKYLASYLYWLLLSIYLSVCLLAYLPTTIYLFVCLCAYLPTYLSYLPACPSSRRPVYLYLTYHPHYIWLLPQHLQYSYFHTQGCLKPVQIKLPPGCFLNPSENAAVVGGNVLTSQRVVDVILKAFSVCAASQVSCVGNACIVSARTTNTIHC